MADVLRDALGRVDPRWPVEPEGWRAAARARVEPAALSYLASVAGLGATTRSNREALDRCHLVPRALGGVERPRLTVPCLGQDIAPFLLAPVGNLSTLDAEAERAIARAAAEAGATYVVPMLSSFSVEAIAAAMGDASRWMQLYLLRDRDVIRSIVARAQANGFEALVLTVDAPVLGWRPGLLGAPPPPRQRASGEGVVGSDPVFRERHCDGAAPTDAVLHGALFEQLVVFPTVDDVRWVRGLTDLPLLVKGVLAVDEAQAVLDAGADGVVVSNHGGRQLDGVLPALDALWDVRDAFPDATLLVDGSIQTAIDVVRGLGVGADAVMIGALQAWALAAGGQEGVAALLAAIRAELGSALSLLGVPGAAAVGRAHVTSRSRA